MSKRTPLTNSGESGRIPTDTPDELKLSERYLNSDTYKRVLRDVTRSSSKPVSEVEARYMSSFSPWKVCVRCGMSTASAGSSDNLLLAIPDGRGEVNHRDGTRTQEYLYVHVACPADAGASAGDVASHAPPVPLE